MPRRRTGIWIVSAVAGTLLVPGAIALAQTQNAIFHHPGVVVSLAQLDLMRSKVQAGAQPWKSAFDQLRSSRYASLSRTPKPRATVECGSHSSPNFGCSDE